MPQIRVFSSVAANALQLAAADADRFSYDNLFVPVSFGSTEINLADSFFDKRSADRSNLKTYGKGAEYKGTPKKDPASIGVMFLERTRVRPSGFVLGEHLLTLSLAPGEEIALEQKSFSEKQVTYEDSNDIDFKYDNETSSTLVTEIQNSLTQTRNNSNKTGLGLSGSVNAKVTEDVNVTANPNISADITQADGNTQAESVKTTNSLVSKIAASFRQQHKTTLKIVSTDRFEKSARRIIRNPNPYTAMDVVTFKVMQKVQVSHERFGVRLCWAPMIPDPGAIFDAAVLAARAQYEAQYPLSVPAEPPMPMATASPPEVVTFTQELTNWGFWGDMAYDYIFDVTPSAGHTWDGNMAFITNSVRFFTTGWGGRSAPGITIRSASRNTDGSAKVMLHAGVAAGGPGQHLTIEFAVNFLPNGVDAAYRARLDAWGVEHRAWEAECARIKKERDAKVDEAMQDWVNQYWKTFNPVSAAMQLFVAGNIPDTARDEGREIEMWHHLFDFANARYKLYPSWWSNRAPRRPLEGDLSFVNASWLRIYLPMRIGHEQQALAWLMSLGDVSTLSAAQLSLVNSVVRQLNGFRKTHFGSETEVDISGGGNCPAVKTPYRCLGAWEELLPTDGVHIETTLANTTAIDDERQVAVALGQDDARTRSGERAARSDLDSNISTRISADGLPANATIVVHTGDSADKTPGS